MNPFLVRISLISLLGLLPGVAPAINILMVTNNTTTSQSLNTFLTGEGHVVTTGRFDTAAPTPADLVGIQLILVARETSSGEYNTGTEPADWNAIPRPMICMAPHIMRNSIWGWVDGAGLSAATANTNYNAYPDTNHPFLTGVTGTQYLSAAPPNTTWNTNAPPTGSTTVATIAAANNPAIFIFPAGTALYNAKGIAANLRIGFIRGDESAWNNTTDVTRQILRNMILFAVPPVGDADNDGLPDEWEIQNGLDPNDNGSVNISNGPNGDPDIDGLLNSGELTRGTFARNPDSDADGYNDFVETNSGSFVGVTTDTGTHALDPDTDNDGLKDGVETNTGFFVNANNSGTHPLVADTESDGMTDGFEVSHMLDPLANDSLLDPDNDMSFNGSEFSRGTNPRNPDTDADGYKDGIETNDGTFDDIATDTGTNPLQPDTDMDGLKDGVETNTGVYAGPSNTGTNPLVLDTDTDKFPDGAEVARNFNPINPASHPAELRALFLGGAATATQGADGTVFSFLEFRYGIGNITYLQASAAVAGSEDGFDVLVLSSTPGSGDVRGKFQNSAVPVINWEEAITDNGVGEFGMATAVMTKSVTTTQMTLVSDPITAGLPSPISLFTGAAAETISTAVPYPGITVLSYAVDGGVTGSAMILLADVGDAVDPAAGITNNMAPARRVMFPMTDVTFNAFGPDARELFGRTIDWAAGLIGDTPLRITSIAYNATLGEITLMWTSDPAPGTTYTLFANSNLDTSPTSWSDISDSIASGGETTTFTFTVNAMAEPTMFYVIQENP